MQANRKSSFSLLATLMLLLTATRAGATLPAVVDGEPLPSLAPVLERVTPSVVNIYTQTRVRVRSPLLDDPFFRRFFNIPDMPRERVSRLLDRGSDFLELSALAGLAMHDDDGRKSVQGGGSIVGIGTVSGKRVVISASDSAVKGGTIAPMGLKKALRAQAIALENKLPRVALVESAA